MTEHPIILFLKAIFRYWWALMSCAAFTMLGIWATYAKKDREWILWSSIALAVVSFLFAAFEAWADEHEAWADEHRKVVELTEKPDVTITVNGICTHVTAENRPVVIVPDVSIANQSHGLRVALTADLWMLRAGGTECWCAPEAKPVSEWEQSQRSYRNKALTLPMNLQPRSADTGYLAFTNMVSGIGNEPLVDQHGHYRYRIDFKDIHTNSVIYHKEITVSPPGWEILAM
jgi:hypothetical protein